MAETSASGAMRTVIDDPVVRVALRELDRKLRERFGREYLRLILFGSRARGDSKPDSDADVAVVLRGHIDNRWSLRRLIIRDTYPILLETGLYIQAWPLEERELDDPDTSANPALLRNVLREGIAEVSVTEFLRSERVPVRRHFPVRAPPAANGLRWSAIAFWKAGRASQRA